ncbi:hypothetical protein EU528_08645 [Candidatus Thorarchaeota archaeon]|nr:MAG: hypothetical protein EU528_08645 [Candidatus Thorarchaeota archaeon]
MVEDDSINPDDVESESIEKIVELADLMEELMSNASALSNDLIEGIGAIGGVAAIMFTVVIMDVLLMITNAWRGPLFVALLILVTLPMVIYGIKFALKFFEMRDKYARIYEIKKQLEK